MTAAKSKVSEKNQSLPPENLVEDALGGVWKRKLSARFLTRWAHDGSGSWQASTDALVMLRLLGLVDRQSAIRAAIEVVRAAERWWRADLVPKLRHGIELAEAWEPAASSEGDIRALAVELATAWMNSPATDPEAVGKATCSVVNLLELVIAPTRDAAGSAAEGVAHNVSSAIAFDAIRTRDGLLADHGNFERARALAQLADVVRAAAPGPTAEQLQRGCAAP